MTKAKTPAKPAKLCPKPSKQAAKVSSQIPFDPELVVVQSSNIKAIGWNDNVLFVQFLTGKLFAYHGVQREQFDAMSQAESIGSYFASNIKGKFPEEKFELSADFPAYVKEETNDETDSNTSNEPRSEKVSPENNPVDNGNPVLPSEQPRPTNGEGSNDGYLGEGDAADGGQGNSDENEGSNQGDESAISLDGRGPQPGENPDYDGKWNIILNHFEADHYRCVGPREGDGVSIFQVSKREEKHGEYTWGTTIATGTFLELLEQAMQGAYKPSNNLKIPMSVNPDAKPVQKHDTTNIEDLRYRLARYQIDLQFEREKDKSEVDHWNLIASVGDEETTRQHSFRITENATKDECNDIHDEIIAAFIRLP